MISSIEPILHSEESLIQEPPSWPTLLASIDVNEAKTLRMLLHQLPQMIEQLECFASKSDLRCFAQWALQQSYSQALTLDEKLHLLDTAWTVQELLWARD